ncbi:Uncharacterized conserved protein, DUF2267 family [Micromonospora pattaloongensis]|uniref:Uncharacterized conserved protein, DUF2267 family n=1 Tax=Micromonospora pattaloongensis TaxID=405436 RepID=A0A1H3I6F7_9ACTN|nr:DUF2267 domain-containing protein [Micromonospora pattaloongensis]SDY23267.1 Uncharacterized conserved protein, DUF2267 family [Micromonospora pattaloongensis]
MKYDKFVDTVARRTKLPYEQAEVLSYTTLQTLAERIPGDEARDLAAQLPKPLHEPLTKRQVVAEQFDVDEFLNRVWQRSGLDAEQVTDGVRAVLTTARSAVTAGEFEDVMAQLPQEFHELAPVPVR